MVTVAKTRDLATEVALFRIWRVANPREWDMTAAEISEELGDVTPNQVGIFCRVAGWSNRLRPSHNYGVNRQTVGNGAQAFVQNLRHEIGQTRFEGEQA